MLYSSILNIASSSVNWVSIPGHNSLIDIKSLFSTMNPQHYIRYSVFHCYHNILAICYAYILCVIHI